MCFRRKPKKIKDSLYYLRKIKYPYAARFLFMILAKEKDKKHNFYLTTNEFGWYSDYECIANNYAFAMEAYYSGKKTDSVVFKYKLSNALPEYGGFVDGKYHRGKISVVKHAKIKIFDDNGVIFENEFDIDFEKIENIAKDELDSKNKGKFYSNEEEHENKLEIQNEMVRLLMYSKECQYFEIPLSKMVSTNLMFDLDIELSLFGFDFDSRAVGASYYDKSGDKYTPVVYEVTESVRFDKRFTYSNVNIDLLSKLSDTTFYSDPRKPDYEGD